MLLVIATALPWSLALGVMGLWLIGEDHQGLLGARAVSLSAGVAVLCGAQIVFLCCIADRLFPQTPGALARRIEGGLGAIFFASSIVLAVSSVGVWVV
jgi:hypothetical protein